MIIYPAIDIKEGKCVRLVQGDFDQKSVYGEPSDMGVKWASKGAEALHMVDLDGAIEGIPVNLDKIEETVKRIKEEGYSFPVQLGGGIRNISDVETVFKKGVSRAIIGTSAIKDKDSLKEMIEKFGDKIAVGIDAKEGMVAVEGWKETSNITAIDLAKEMEKIGVRTIIYTDISRDGMLQGPNLKAMEDMVIAVPTIDVIASGGVGKIEDIENLNKTGVSGCIVGKALYTGDVLLEEAVKVAKE